MILAILIILIILWFLGYISVPSLHIPNIVLFPINGHPITLYNLLIFLVICWLIGILPGPFRQIAGVLLILYVLALLGIFAFAGLSGMIVIAIIVGLIIYLIGGF